MVDSVSLPVITSPEITPIRIALVGNPNAGKTSLFNRLTGLRAKTANFPGTTVDHRRAHAEWQGQALELIDLPGLYSLETSSPEELVAKQAIGGELPGVAPPDVYLIVVDATNLERNLILASQVIELDKPTIVALNQIDMATRKRLQLDIARLEGELGCPVVPVSARTGQGLAELRQGVLRIISGKAPSAEGSCGSCRGCHHTVRFDWAERVSSQAIRGPVEEIDRATGLVDRVLTHPVWGVLAFGIVMFLAFLLIFWLAQYPMELMDQLFGLAQVTLGQWIPEGDFQSLIVDGVVGGVGGMLVFLPQICILFFILALLEDSGYLARAALVMDKHMQRVGLPGKAFVPLLSAHACAIPAILSTRVIENRRDRLLTILVLPLMTCSARLPVYALVVALLFPNDAVKASILFGSAYLLGIVAAIGAALVFRKTILPGASRPLIIELPHYRRPALRNALLLVYDRARDFVVNAGTTILVISLVLWALATYPKTDRADLTPELETQIAQLEASGNDAAAESLLQQVQLERSFAGRIGKAAQPLFAPLGFDWKTSIGVMTSFAAREVVVSTLSVLYGMGDGGAEQGDSLYDNLRASKHADGSPVFTTATCLSLLVFFVLAAQCLPTQVVTKRETGSWKWAAIQLAYMSVLAYVGALVAYQAATLLA